jgi:hypothetical protein
MRRQKYPQNVAPKKSPVQQQLEQDSQAFMDQETVALIQLQHKLTARILKVTRNRIENQ